MPKSPPKPKAAEELSFEAAFEELEQTVRQLEEGQLALEESLALFERGQALSARCQQLLESAELKVQQLAPRANGEAGWELQDFDEEGA